jgi:hypothetical protein
MSSQTMQPVAIHAESGFRRTAVPSVEHTAARNLARKKTVLREKLLGLSSELAQASAILANRAGEIANFTSALPDNCGREDAAEQIAAFIDSLCPALSSFQFRPAFRSGLGEIIANRVNVNRVTCILVLNTIGLLGLAAILIAAH